jgi:hypothetical protein
MKQLLILLSATLIISSCSQKPSTLLFSSEKYSIYTDSVVQPPFRAIATSETEIISDYQSPVTDQVNSLIRFKFSLNSRDNEMPAGVDHYITLCPVNGSAETPPIKFGLQTIDTTNIPVTILPENTKWLVKLDMRDMVKAFSEKGFYELYNGGKIYSTDFKGVYIAGASAPLIWDFENLRSHQGAQLTDDNQDGIYELIIILNPTVDRQNVTSWKLSTDISAFPGYNSDQVLVDALYNLSLEEMVKDIRTDSTFMAGEKWDGVWTRDISYAITLSLAAINPEISKNSLLRKVKNKRIIQDTGTGGSWPVSTDRVTWALAAWEVFKVTGDHEWLKQAFEIIRNSVEDDKFAAFDEKTGLMCGESSFLDWREQTYPKWMEPIDIYQSKNLGTNTLHYQTYRILANMAGILNVPAGEYEETAEKIKAGINQHLWMPDKGYYAQYLFGKYSTEISPRSESLGEALCVLFDIADSARQKEIISKTPVTEFGIPCIYPQIPDIQPYHNNAVWPFLQAYWTLASAKADNGTSVLEGLGSIYRQSALFLSNKENFVAENGDFKGTAINSNRQLWSVAGNLAMVYKLFFGMDFQSDGIAFAPYVPQSFRGDKVLSGFNYRKMQLTIRVNGFGTAVKSFSIDGKKSDRPFLQGDLEGKHTIEIELNNKPFPESQINKKSIVYEAFRADTEEVEVQKSVVVEAENFASASGLPFKGYSGKGFVELNKQLNTNFQFVVNVPQSGEYYIEFMYSNGSGPINTDNKCCIRTLKSGDKILGPIVMPQRGKEEWSNWGLSNALLVKLTNGENHFSLSLEPWDENMNGEVNTAMIDFVQATKK